MGSRYLCFRCEINREHYQLHLGYRKELAYKVIAQEHMTMQAKIFVLLKVQSDY